MQSQNNLYFSTQISICFPIAATMRLRYPLMTQVSLAKRNILNNPAN